MRVQQTFHAKLQSGVRAIKALRLGLATLRLQEQVDKMTRRLFTGHAESEQITDISKRMVRSSGNQSTAFTGDHFKNQRHQGSHDG